MDPSGVPWTRQRHESPGEICFDAIHEEQFILDVSSGRKNNKSERRSNYDIRTDLDVVPREATFHDIVQGRPDASLLKASFEGLVNANLKVNADLNAIFQTRELEFQEQKQLVCQAQRENQTLRELLITERNSRTTQVVEFQKTMCVIKDEIAQLRQDMNNVPAICEDSMATNIEMAIGQLFRDHQGLDKDLRKCRIQLESATHNVNLKTNESEQLTTNNLLLEEANSKLKLKVEEIQLELCKEKEGHHGSHGGGSPTPLLCETMAKEMFSSIATFSILLTEYKDSSGSIPAYSLTVGSELWKRVLIAQTHHWTYVLKNIICNGLFKDFEYETFLSSDSSVLFLDQEERVSKCLKYYEKSKNAGSSEKAPASNTRGDRLDLFFCHYFRNQIRLLPSEIRQHSMAFRDYDELVRSVHNKIPKLENPADRQPPLVTSLIIAAKMVWDFHKLCLSFDPPATIFRVSPGDPFNADYMESIDTPDHSTVPIVGWMVFPGFRLRKSVIKCQVYLSLKT